MNPRAAFVLLSAVALGSCAGRKNAPVRPVTVEVQVGTISLIDTDHNFVMIDATYTPQPGAILEEMSAANANVATLKVSPEKQPPFIIADVVKGTPQVGDRVMLGKQAAPEATKPPGITTVPASEERPAVESRP